MPPTTTTASIVASPHATRLLLRCIVIYLTRMAPCLRGSNPAGQRVRVLERFLKQSSAPALIEVILTARLKASRLIVSAEPRIVCPAIETEEALPLLLRPAARPVQQEATNAPARYS